ncbi:MAG: [FeFe] hydrogenase H-cluster radical SAM maturase HydE [Clostridia bacterium]|nr:[FeFe] hydrogenase H-cluster radical SAM maturase HydE [Clostridia bacterium]
METIIEKLAHTHDLADSELKTLIETDKFDKELFSTADAVRRQAYGTDVYIRGLIEFTNFCKRNCYYCGIRRDNCNAQRYRLTKDEILECCDTGYSLGFRTFVLQGGEDEYFTDEVMCDIVSAIKTNHPDCVITLSIGERSYETYQKLRIAGADRYLLRHETATEEHYEKLHPKSSKLIIRKKCLYDLKQLGYQVGSGFMIGSPYQTTENIISDLRFLQELKPHMIGIGPFISHGDTPFANEPSGTFEMTVRMISILRLMFPESLIPATTALGTIKKGGREFGLSVGANVVMPNLSPKSVRKKYSIYKDKICTDEEAAEGVAKLRKSVEKAGYNVVTHIGHAKSYISNKGESDA